MSDYISKKEILKHQYRINDSATLSTRDVVNVEDIENATSADVISIDQANAMIKSYVSHYEENVHEEFNTICANKKNVGENKLVLGNGATPFTVADAVIRECPDKNWLKDIVFFLNVYIERTYVSEEEVQAEK